MSHRRSALGVLGESKPPPVRASANGLGSHEGLKNAIFASEEDHVYPVTAEAPITAPGANTSASTHHASSPRTYQPPGLPKRTSRLPPKPLGLGSGYAVGKDLERTKRNSFVSFFSFPLPRRSTRPVQRARCFHSRRRRGAQSLSFTVFFAATKAPSEPRRAPRRGGALDSRS